MSALIITCYLELGDVFVGSEVKNLLSGCVGVCVCVCVCVCCCCSVVSNCLWPHGLQRPRLPCAPLSPRGCSNSCPLSRWCHPTISSSVVPFISCLLSFPESGSFPMGWLFASGNQSIGASASASVLPMNWFDLLAAQGILKGLLQHHNLKASILRHSAFFMVSHPYRTTRNAP